MSLDAGRVEGREREVDERVEGDSVEEDLIEL